VRAQAAQALIAFGQLAASAWADPAFVRRIRHGDPTAMTELRARACVQAGAAAAAVEALLQRDPALMRLWEQTAELARSASAEAAGHRARTILLMAVGAAILCVTAWAIFTYYQGQAALHRIPASPTSPAP
jgi:hypothetical protein